MRVVLYNLRAIDVKVGVCCRSGANGQNCDTMTQARSSEDGDQTETHVRCRSATRAASGYLMGKKGGVRRGSGRESEEEATREGCSEGEVAKETRRGRAKTGQTYTDCDMRRDERAGMCLIGRFVGWISSGGLNDQSLPCRHPTASVMTMPSPRQDRIQPCNAACSLISGSRASRISIGRPASARPFDPYQPHQRTTSTPV